VQWIDADIRNESVGTRIKRAETRMLEALRELELVMREVENENIETSD